MSNDEQGSANFGVPPDLGYQGFDGRDAQGNSIQSMHDIRKYTLWGNLMGGGAGVEYYFGYSLANSDLVAENFRSRDRQWDYAAIALDFFRRHLPFWEMDNADGLVGNFVSDNRRYAFAKPGEIYVVYLPHGSSADLDLRSASGRFTVSWFDPRQGGALRQGSVTSVAGGSVVALGQPPSRSDEDWAVLIRR